MESPGIIIAFFAGVLSIASPCILPIMPSFLAYITGVSLSDGYKKLEKKELRKKLFLNTLLFGIGFSVIFLFFGAVIGIIGETLLLNRSIFQTVGGVIIVIFGLQLTGLINLKFLMKEKKFELTPRLKTKFKKTQYLRSFLMGVFFAFGWAPCYGPIIGAIFTLAATQANFWQAVLLFFFYSLGLLVPLLFFTAIIARGSDKLKKFRKAAKYTSIIAGGIVVLLGILLMTNQLSSLVYWINLSYNGNNISLP